MNSHWIIRVTTLDSDFTMTFYSGTYLLRCIYNYQHNLKKTCSVYVCITLDNNIVY